MASPFLDRLAQRVLFIDGAMGTSIHNWDLDLEKDYRNLENCTEILVDTRPDVIQQIHESFLEVGADCVETDTFGANKLVFAEFDLVERTRELNRKAVEIARAACDEHSTKDKPRFVLGSMGPGTKLVTLGHTTWDEMLESYAEQARGLLDGGTDAFIIETCQDILQVKCATNAILKAMEEQGVSPEDIPILVSVTIETTGAMLLGTEISAAAQALERFPIASLGLNCATGPTEMAEHVRWLARHWPRHISIVPNAGLPALVDGKTEYPLKPEPFAQAQKKFVEESGVSLVGGCCGTTPEHIRCLVEAVGERAPQKVEDFRGMPKGCSSLYSAVDYRQENSFLIVGERTNTNGSRKFKRLLDEDDFDGLVSMGRELLREGSHVLDLCVDYVGRDGVEDMEEVVSRFVQHVAAPLMIDSTQTDVMEAGLKRAGGKCILNSMNLEDGEEKFAEICNLARKYGAAVVAGTIDEDPKEAMGKTADRKFEIAAREYDLAVNKYGLAPEDLMFDPLVLPVTTGVEADRRLALETVEGIRRISEEFPECQITIGLSNVSFGLKPAARVVLNSVFLHECRQAGLTSAIVHFSKILPRNKIDDEKWQAALDLIYDKRTEDFDPLQAFIKLFPEGEDDGVEKEKLEDLPLEERLQRHIIDGERQGLTETLDEAMEKYGPLDIVNDHLLAGMKVVGDLFGRGEMQLPFVLQSAEVMKRAVAHLEPHMPKVEGKGKGRMVLATVQGDVHDIGKNLVDIILSNNGYEVVNLGIKQPIASILKAQEEHEGDAIGLSGLLVKSVGVMQDNLKEMAERGIDVPVILGGAALNRHYCETTLRDTYETGKVYFGKDAFEGLRLMDAITQERTGELDSEIEERLVKRAKADKKIEAARQKKKDEKEKKKETAEVEAKPAKAAEQPEPAPTTNGKPAAPAKKKPAPEPAVAVAESNGAATAVRSEVARDVEVPEAPFWGDRIVDQIDIEDVYPFVNTIALFRGQWQFKRGRKSQEEFDAQIKHEVEPLFERLKKQCKEENILHPRVVYGYYPVASDGDDLIVFHPEDHDREIERFSFPRQSERKRLCISDFFRSPDELEPGERDVLGLSCVTMGEEVSERAKALFEGNDYSEYLYLHGMGVECAEALAEMWHKRMRMELGIGGEDAPRIRDLFTQKYRGSRYSFGYPACPEMSDQEKLFRLLKPERIGCVLSENWQIVPEQSTSAIVVHHPEAKYFNV